MLLILTNIHNKIKKKKKTLSQLSRKGKEELMWVRGVAAMD